VRRSLAFQSSPAHVGGCYVVRRQGLRQEQQVSILTRPRGRVLQSGSMLPSPITQVLILTRPRGRVLPDWYEACNKVFLVSILTRPRGRVLQGIAGPSVTLVQFQSSPAHVGGCYAVQVRHRKYIRSFNPHPPTWAGATSGEWVRVERTVFQSSPAHVGGCYGVVERR